MISAEQVTTLAGSLGTVEGLTRVNESIESLTQHLTDSKEVLSSCELARMLGALNSLSAAILSMDRVARALLGRPDAGAVDCVG
jgi:hypothetical protein